MSRRIAAVIEIVALILLLSFALRWAWKQEQWFEPYTVICGCVLAGLEWYRRKSAHDKPVLNAARSASSLASGELLPGPDSGPALLAWLLSHAPSKDLSETLPVALRLAHKIGDKDFERWVRFEINGYNQDQMIEGESVPEYRNVPDRYVDRYKEMAPYYPDIPALNVCRMWNGVRELEHHSKTNGEMTIRDPDVLGMIRERLGFDAVRFVSNPAAIRAGCDPNPTARTAASH
jgi:AbiTii